MFTRRTSSIRLGVALAACLAALPAREASAQWRVGSDSATRLARFGRSLAYGSLMGLGFAGVSQLTNSPPEWGTGWNGYKKRAASGLGEFVIQESVTDGLAAVMNRPLDYKRCSCTGFGPKFASAARGAVTDQMPDGSHPIAVPRIVGAYVGSGAQALWRQNGTGQRFASAAVNGTASLATGVLINLFYEYRRH